MLGLPNGLAKNHFVTVVQPSYIVSYDCLRVHDVVAPIVSSYSLVNKIILSQKYFKILTRDVHKNVRLIFCTKYKYMPGRMIAIR